MVCGHLCYAASRLLVWLTTGDRKAIFLLSSCALSHVMFLPTTGFSEGPNGSPAFKPFSQGHSSSPSGGYAAVMLESLGRGLEEAKIAERLSQGNNGGVP